MEPGFRRRQLYFGRRHRLAQLEEGSTDDLAGCSGGAVGLSLYGRISHPAAPTFAPNDRLLGGEAYFTLAME
jgi:hypothetical protein